MAKKLTFHKSPYSTMPKSPQKDNQAYVKKTFDWIYREEHRWGGKTWRFICKSCNHSQKGPMGKCTNCGSEDVVSLTPDTRVPRKKANKRKWKNFIKNFVNNRQKI